MVGGLECVGEVVRIAKSPLSQHDMFVLSSQYHQGAILGNEQQYTEELLLTGHV